MSHHQVQKHLGALAHDNGVNFAVWAPFATQVSLLLQVEFAWKETPLMRDDNGYWSIEDIDAEPGQSYKYKIVTEKGEELERNDPYARQITDSDNGASVIAVRDFDWEGTDRFVAIPKEKAIIYELHIGTFNKPDASTAGTFASAIEKLDYLAGLGVNYIELMPVTSMASSHGWGYAPNYIFSVENSYGGRHGLLNFVKACHEKNIGVILDVVYNHFFIETDLWQYDGWNENDLGGIYFYNDERGKTPWGGRPDYGRPEVRQFILDNVTMWLTEYKIDGLRVDSTIYMRNTDGNNDKHEFDIPDAWSLMADINELAHKINPNALMIAEDNSSNTGIVTPIDQNGAGFDAQWEVGFPHVIRDALGITQNTSQAPLDGIIYELTHTYTGSAFDKVIFSDSHDTAANGSVRLNEAASPGNAASVSARQRLLLASGMALTAPGIPMLLQGQEFMQEGAFNDWKMLEWDKTTQFAGIVLAHQHLINLRTNVFNNTRGLTGEFVQILHRDDDNTVVAFYRKDGDEPGDGTVVIFNFGDKLLKNYELTFPSTGDWRIRFNSCWKGYSVDFHETHFAGALVTKNNKAQVSLAPYSFIILSLDVSA